MDIKEEIKQIAYDFTTSKGDCKKLENRILSLFGVVRTLCDCKEHSIKTNYGFEVCTKCGNEFND